MTSVEDFAIAATKRYLQSIVFIDDEIYLPVSGKPAEAVISIPQLKSPFASKVSTKLAAAKTGLADAGAAAASATDAPPATEKTKVEQGAPPVPEKDAAPPYHPKQLVESFAREGMVCALYEPSKGFASTAGSELFKLCERADAVILDWDLYQEDGRNILPLLASLVSQSQTSVPHHVRLCAVYTTKPDLEHVASQIYDYLIKEKLTVDPVKTLSLSAGATKIVVLGKPNSTGRKAEIQTLAEVAEKDLATRIISEFAEMHRGILPSVALHAMSAIRMNSKKILDKFHADMDGAFLLHRALTLKDEDAFAQLPELVAEEALAVMLESQVENETLKALATEVAEGMPFQSIDWAVIDGRPKLAKGILPRRFLAGGEAAIEEDHKIKKMPAAIEKLHGAMGCATTHADKKVAALFALRTQYLNLPPSLTFGTIVRVVHEGTASDQYAMCLMPLCDSVRLPADAGKTYTFPFWSLDLQSVGAASRGIVVSLSDNEYVELFARGKPRDNLWIESFSASVGGTVKADQSTGRPVFSGVTTKLEWIAQMKPDHAQRVAQDIGQSLSRIGVVEAEWLRLKSSGK